MKPKGDGGIGRVAERVLGGKMPTIGRSDDGSNPGKMATPKK